jgi:hypothetical protein
MCKFYTGEDNDIIKIVVKLGLQESIGYFGVYVT